MNHYPELISEAPEATSGLEKQARELFSQGLLGDATIAVMRAFLWQRDTASQLALTENTRLLYEREFRRLLYFMGTNGITSLDAINKQDAEAYIHWRANPPAELISEDGIRVSRSHSSYRLFAKKPKISSTNSSHRVIKSFFHWMLQAGFVTTNPWAMIKQSKSDNLSNQRAYNRRKTLTEDDVRLISYYLDAEHLHEGKNVLKKVARYRWIFYSYLLLGLRASELVSTNTDALKQEIIKGNAYWELLVTGKGEKTLDVPVPEMFIKELKRYRLSLGKPALPELNSGEPFIFNLSGTAPLSTRQQVFREYKNLMKEVVSRCGDSENPEQAQRLEGSSPHSLRHTFVTSLLDLTDDYASVRELARHSSLETTMSYDNSQRQHRHDIIERNAAKLDKN